MNYYPVFLDLHDRQVLVAGGGEIAFRKVVQLLSSRASIKVVSPQLIPALRRLVQKDLVSYRKGEFNVKDMDDAWLVVVATGDPRLNRRIARFAEQRHIFCNVVDKTRLCTFIAPAIVERGKVMVAVSTSGSSPVLAQHIRNLIKDHIGTEYAQFADLMDRWRAKVLRKIPQQKLRAEIFHEMVASDILDLLRSGNTIGAEQRAGEIFRAHIERGSTKILGTGQR
ncbi:bifunctional precorrin-2 dehydrogenase/sirohydrochlorin ferrochelatase [bacterium]|nr:bifunctional precorrin-2 dehydrogenase/sirohydrochlorin ferrochelatase [bacterium]